MVGPVIYTFGSEAQKKHYLPRIANVDDWWCQGFSEPGSGSDLASLKTKPNAAATNISSTAEDLDHLGAIRRLDLLPVPHRPGAKKQSGISFILIDMKTKASRCVRSRPSTAASKSTKCSSTTSSAC